MVHHHNYYLIVVFNVFLAADHGGCVRRFYWHYHCWRAANIIITYIIFADEIDLIAGSKVSRKRILKNGLPPRIRTCAVVLQRIHQ